MDEAREAAIAGLELEPGFTIARFRNGSIAALREFNTREAEQGTRFHYASSETVILAVLLRAVTGATLSEYLTARLWQPIGAEALGLAVMAVSIVATIGLTLYQRRVVRERVGQARFAEVFVNTDPALCRERRPDGDFEGFEAPDAPDLTLSMDQSRVERAVDKIIELLAQRGQVDLG